jgi:nucleotide-binding universal stress UspA family protein
MAAAVIVGYEGSDHSKDALAFGEPLAAAEDARLVVACVHPLQPRTSAIGEAGFDREVRAGAQRTAESARGLLARADEAEFSAVLGLSAADGLVGLARERGASAIVVGSSHRGGIGRVFSGSVAGRLVGDAPCAVGVAPGGYVDNQRAALSLVGVAFDGSPESTRALHLAERLAARFRGRLRVIAVTESDGETDLLSSKLNEALVSAPVSARAKGDLRHGDPAPELARASAELDLLVCGSRGYGRARRLILGSVSAALMSSARCPMLIVRGA